MVYFLYYNIIVYINWLELNYIVFLDLKMGFSF